MGFSFDQYRRIFDGAVAKYEVQPFFQKLVEQRGRPRFPTAPREVAAFGIRHEGPTTEGRENTADDTISLVRRADSGAPQVFEYVGTTESGLFAQVINAEGDFKMSPGIYFFRRGLHKQTFPCLVQAGPVLGERAKKGMDFDETDNKVWEITDGSLHIHAGILNVHNVANWSAGCQVIAGGWEGKAWKEFYKCCELAANEPIPYILVNEADLPAFL